MDEFTSPKLQIATADTLHLSNEGLIDLIEAVLSKGFPFRFRAKGGSMTPFIRDEDIITLAPISDRSPGVGQVVAFTHPETGNLVVHRIIAKQGADAFIHGDGVAGKADGIVSPEYILGRVTLVERNQHRIWLGLGPERFLIAWLSCKGYLIPLRTILAAWRDKLFQR